MGSEVKRWANPFSLAGGGAAGYLKDALTRPKNEGPGHRARREEAERQAHMAEGERNVNAAFDSPARQKQYSDFVKALRENFMADANRQKGVADRRLKFAMARSGLSGGSEAVSSNKRLGEEFSRGIVNSENQAQGALSDLKGDDEAARQSLISMIRAGSDTGVAASRAASMQSSNAQGAQARALTQGIGDIFGSTIDTYSRAEDAAARRRGARDAQMSLYSKPFSG
jgi:hypothetical protein